MTISVIDVFSPQFKRSIVVSSDSDLWLLSSVLSRITATSITVNNNCGNSASFTSLDFTPFSLLRQITIGDNCFGSVREVKLSGLSELESVVVGSNSFRKSNSGGLYMNGCSSLKTVMIGDGSFASFAVFDITDAPFLEEVRIGNGCLKNVDLFVLSGLSGLESVMIGSDSFSQRSGHFALTSPSVKALVVGDGSFTQYTDCSIRDVSSLETLSIGDNSFVVSSLELKRLNGLKSVVIGRRGFENCERAVFESLPELTSIQLGWSALAFKDIDNATLVMKSV